MFTDDTQLTHPVKPAGFDAAKATGVVVIGSLALLILIRKGFPHGFAAGVSVAVK